MQNNTYIYLQKMAQMFQLKTHKYYTKNHLEWKCINKKYMHIYKIFSDEMKYINIPCV